MRSLRAAGAALLVLLAAACREPEAGLHVEIDGPLEPGADFDRLTLVAYLAGDGTPLYAEALDAPELPVSFNLVSGPGTPEGTEVEVLASAERAGEVVSAVRGKSVLERAEGATLALTLPAIPVLPDGGIVEACDDGVDDDGDGLADCADPDCDATACAGGGQVCGNGVCGCPGGAPLGVWSTPVPGFLPRSGAQALALEQGPATGAVLLAGGVDTDGAPTGVVELYRPGISLQTFTLQAPRTGATWLVNATGGVALAGGDPIPASGPEPLPIEQLDVDALGAFASTLEPPLAFSGARALPTDGGWVLFGGTLGNELVALTPPEDGVGTWDQRSFASLGTERSGAVRLDDGRWIFASGPTATDLTELVDTEGVVTVGPRLPEAIAGAALAPLPGGAALLVGGETSSGAPSSRAFVLAAQGGTVSVREVGELHQAIAAPVALALGNGWIYVESANGSAAEWFDFASERFVPATAPPTATANAALAAFQARLFRSGGTRESDGAASDEGAFLELKCAP